MAFDLIPKSYWSYPKLINWDDDDDWLSFPSNPGGLSVSEDDKNVYVSAHVPGIDPKDIEVTFDKGMLWIKGETKTEEKGKKFYRKSANSFSYRVNVPGEIDNENEPTASCKNGVMTVTFVKSPKTQPKKIAVKSG